MSKFQLFHRSSDKLILLRHKIEPVKTFTLLLCNSVGARCNKSWMQYSFLTEEFRRSWKLLRRPNESDIPSYYERFDDSGSFNRVRRPKGNVSLSFLY